jgi:NAD(P)-dependent dehydrogenase (short-subunit alcohol dehydrogenase family)
MMKTAMIWGANGGIGRALTKKLAAEQWRVIAIVRNGNDVSGAALTIQADVTNARAVETAVTSAAYDVDAVDLWIYAAGDITSAKIGKMTPEEWQRIVAANLLGPYLTTHYSLPLLAENAQLIFLGAVSERLRLPGLSAYAAAKSGLEAFADTLRKEQRQHRILVVRPGAVTTPFWDKVPLRLPKDAASPEKVSIKILEAYENGDSGTLNLT